MRYNLKLNPLLAATAVVLASVSMSTAGGPPAGGVDERSRTDSGLDVTAPAASESGRQTTVATERVPTTAPADVGAAANARKVTESTTGESTKSEPRKGESTTTEPTTNTTTVPTKVPLDDRFSGMYEISFRPFASAVDANTEGQREVRVWQDEKRGWRLVFDRSAFDIDNPLTDSKGLDGRVQSGYQTGTANTLRAQNTSNQILRDEVLDLGDHRIGLLAASLFENNKFVLLQQAIVEITPRVYCSIGMTSPLATADPTADPAVPEAVKTFEAMVDSIEMVDLSKVRDDQDLRLLRTRGLFVSWNEKTVLQALIPERYVRLVKEGRDVGYAYVVEQPASSLPGRGEIDRAATNTATKSPGVRVGVRQRLQIADGKSVDSESWQYVTFDRQHEIWSTVAVVADPAAPRVRDRTTWASEVGASDKSIVRKFNPKASPNDFADYDRETARREKGLKPLEPSKEIEVPYRMVEQSDLVVRNESESKVGQPVKRELPPFYVPKALVSLLPRLVPLDTPNGYLLASYDSVRRQVMLHYLDVSALGQTNFNGRPCEAIVVSERLGDDPAIDHLFSPDGTYLGSVDRKTKIESIVTDRATLEKTWAGANLNAPSEKFQKQD